MNIEIYKIIAYRQLIEELEQIHKAFNDGSKEAISKYRKSPIYLECIDHQRDVAFSFADFIENEKAEIRKKIDICIKHS